MLIEKTSDSGVQLYRAWYKDTCSKWETDFVRAFVSALNGNTLYDI